MARLLFQKTLFFGNKQKNIFFEKTLFFETQIKPKKHCFFGRKILDIFIVFEKENSIFLRLFLFR